MAIAGFALVIFKFVGFHSITDQVIQFCMAHFAIIGFLVLSYNLLYDVCEVYEFKTGEMLTGVMISYFSFSSSWARQLHSRQLESFWTWAATTRRSPYSRTAPKPLSPIWLPSFPDA